MTNVRTKRMLAYGVGLNDADYPVTRHEVVDGKHQIVWKCPIYTTWRSMLTRCYSPGYQASKPTYVGCSVALEWHLFSAFRAWVITKDWHGKQLDKDLLQPGNKHYSPETCCFVGGTVNSFITDNAASRGAYPLGVSWHKKTGKVQARCGNPHSGQDDYLGVFDCPNKAHLAWATRKLKHAVVLAAQQTDQRIAAALIAMFETRHAAARVSLTINT